VLQGLQHVDLVVGRERAEHRVVAVLLAREERLLVCELRRGVPAEWARRPASVLVEELVGRLRGGSREIWLVRRRRPCLQLALEPIPNQRPPSGLQCRVSGAVVGAAGFGNPHGGACACLAVRRPRMPPRVPSKLS
jgi:hypothetical protein